MLLIKKHKVTDIREGFLDKTEVFHIFKTKRTLPLSKVIMGEESILTLKVMVFTWERDIVSMGQDQLKKVQNRKVVWMKDELATIQQENFMKIYDEFIPEKFVLHSANCRLYND